MPIFQISSRTVQVPGSPVKPAIHLRWWQYAILRYSIGGLIIYELIRFLSSVGLFFLFFLFLPVGMGFIVTRSQLSRLLHGTLLYNLLTIGLSLMYYGAITGIEFFIHTPGVGLLFFVHGPPVPIIIVVTTTLAWAVILAPLYTYLQTLINQRFKGPDYEAARAVETFTSTLREEIDLDKVRNGLLAVVQKTMQPQSVSVWVRATGQEEKESQVTQDESKKNEEYINIAENDPFVTYALSHPNTIEVNRLQLDSPLLHTFQKNGVAITSPLVSQGELLGLLTLEPRLNREKYTREDRSLLDTLAAQVAPALRVAQMVQEQQAQVREHERLAQELRTAHFIQQSLLPKEVPTYPRWQITPYYQPAREVGGDFYDFLPFENGQLGIVIGDVSGKGVPAALVMANTHTMIRTAAQGAISPGEALTQVNELLCTEIPSNMFVTCFYAILDPISGKLRYANAGHDLPYRRSGADVCELHATGMPLGLLPGMQYEEQEALITTGEHILLYSDGLVEAHNPVREMFGFPRLKQLIVASPSNISGDCFIDLLLQELKCFTGEGWEQEDDITLIVLQRIAAPSIEVKPLIAQQTQ